jgi:hypothetical protein
MKLMCLAAVALDGEARQEEGDIIDLAVERHYIGQKEAERWLWLPVQEPVVFEEEIKTTVSDESLNILWKRRFNLSFPTLKLLFPDFDPVLARDITTIYQPFVTLETDPGEERIFLTEIQPVVIDGLVWDKQETRYV